MELDWLKPSVWWPMVAASGGYMIRLVFKSRKDIDDLQLHHAAMKEGMAALNEHMDNRVSDIKAEINRIDDKLEGRYANIINKIDDLILYHQRKDN
jgi:hypothetical protein